MREVGPGVAAAALGGTDAIGLAGLALLDSLSVGTLVIPILMLLNPRIRAGSVLLYLAVLAAFYLAVGVALLAGALAILPAVGDAGASPVLLWVQLAVGALLFLASFFVGPDGERRRTDRVAAWSARLESVANGRGVVALAFTAGVLEVATMVPYLGAIGLLASASTGPPAKGAVLSAYVVVMCLPAGALVLLRSAAGQRAAPALRRLGDWLAEQAAATFPWLIGLLGWFVAGSAASQLF